MDVHFTAKICKKNNIIRQHTDRLKVLGFEATDSYLCALCKAPKPYSQNF